MDGSLWMQILPDVQSRNDSLHVQYFDLPIYPISWPINLVMWLFFPQVVDIHVQKPGSSFGSRQQERIGVTDHPARAGVLKNAVIRGQSLCMENGKNFTACFPEGKQTGMAVAAE
jgi:hypothetical protein